jgi:hypothetical protein
MVHGSAMASSTAPYKDLNGFEAVRVGDVIGGHVHPSLCVAANGDVLVVFNREGGGGKELLISRSSDGGTNWVVPEKIAEITDDSIYPGSLTTLQDGRILLNWSCYRPSVNDRQWREPRFCLSEDNGETWSDTKSYPISDLTDYTCMRQPVVELSPNRWICPFYDRTVVYDSAGNSIHPFGDGRNHGMVPIVLTGTGTLVSGAPQTEAPVPVGVPGNMVYGLRSTDGGEGWDALDAFPHFGVAGYDLIVLQNGWLVLTYIVYGIGHDGEYAYSMIISKDDGVTWGPAVPIEVFNPGKRIMGRGWPRSAQLDDSTLGTLFYDLDPEVPGGPAVFFVRTPISRLEAG